MIYSYLGVLVLFLGSVIAIRSETWERYNAGFDKLTNAGIVALFLAGTGMFVASMTIFSTNEEIKFFELRLNELEGEVEAREHKIMRSGIVLNIYERVLGQLKSSLAKGKDLIESSGLLSSELYNPEPEENIKPVISEAREIKTVPGGFSQPVYARVMADYLNIRSGPGLEYLVLGMLSKNVVVSVVGTEGRWMNIALNGRTDGWVAGKYLSAVGAETGFVKPAHFNGSAPAGALEVAARSARQVTCIVNAELLNVRSGPGRGYPVVDLLPKGSVVAVIKNDDKWVKVKFGDRGGGWVVGSFGDISDCLFWRLPPGG